MKTHTTSNSRRSDSQRIGSDSHRAGSKLQRRGSALVVTLLALMVLVAMTGAILATSGASKRENGAAIERTRALYAAESGVCDVLTKLAAHLPCATLGTQAVPIQFADGGYWATIVDNHDDTFAVTSVGQAGRLRRAIQAVITYNSGGVFQNAVFAGNSSGDGAYSLKFGGTGGQADAVTGDIYSGNDILLSGTSTVQGVVRADGVVGALAQNITAAGGGTPAAPQEGVHQPLPNIAAMHYEVHNDVDVAQHFATASYHGAPAGGQAWQLPANDPAHIFRKNPSDRVANWSTTSKEDYFLEDPYNPMHNDGSSNGSDSFIISLTNPSVNGSSENSGASPGNPAYMGGGVDGNRKVYFIDGNLWINNLSTMSLQFEYPGGGPVQITVVVKGNIYIGDNIYLKDRAMDGVAFIAMKDSGVVDSGNIYFGDPNFGTLEHMDSFMYAENNFYDTNLNAAGSATVTLNGNMTAGNQVAINRDFGAQHSKLTVNFDDRIATGAITLPGLPSQSGAEPTWGVSVWHEVAVP